MADVHSPDDPGHGPMILGVSWALASLATIAIAVRFYVRLKLAHTLSSDDWIMLVAGILQLAFQACLTKAYQAGLGKYDSSLTYAQAVEILKWSWISSTPAIMVSIVARISITVLLVRIFGTKTMFKVFIIAFTTLQSIVASVLVIVVWVQVSPVEGLWDVLLPARRWDTKIQQDMAFLAQALFTFSDLTYVLFPVIIVFRLHMPLRQRIGLGALLAAGLFTMAASIMKTTTSQSSSATDAEYNASVSVIWSAVEQSLVIIMGCVPPLRAIVNLEVPATVRQIGISLASLLSGGSSGSRSRTQVVPGTSGAVSGSYQDLEMNSWRNRSKPGSKPPSSRDTAEAVLKGPPSNVEITRGDQNESWNDGGAIRKTEQFTLTIPGETHPRSNV